MVLCDHLPDSEASSLRDLWVRRRAGRVRRESACFRRSSDATDSMDLLRRGEAVQDVDVVVILQLQRHAKDQLWVGEGEAMLVRHIVYIVEMVFEGIMDIRAVWSVTGGELLAKVMELDEVGIGNKRRFRRGECLGSGGRDQRETPQ